MLWLLMQQPINAPTPRILLAPLFKRYLLISLAPTGNDPFISDHVGQLIFKSVRQAAEQEAMASAVDDMPSGNGFLQI